MPPLCSVVQFFFNFSFTSPAWQCNTDCPGRQVHFLFGKGINTINTVKSEHYVYTHWATLPLYTVHTVDQPPRQYAQVAGGTLWFPGWKLSLFPCSRIPQPAAESQTLKSLSNSRQHKRPARTMYHSIFSSDNISSCIVDSARIFSRTVLFLFKS